MLMPSPAAAPPKPPTALPVGLPRSAQLRLELLPAFDAAARLLSFTGAAQELHLTQSAVSRQIQMLEENLGVPLFVRRHRALALTTDGERMHRATRDALARLSDTVAHLRAARRGRQFTITCTPGFASLWLIPRLAKFTDQRPDLDVRISATLDVLDLQQSQIDLAVRFVPTERGRGPALFEETVLPLCAPSLLRARRGSLRNPADLSQQTLLAIDMPDGEPLTMDWEPWLRLMGLQQMKPKNALHFTQYADAVAAAVAGQGLVIGRLPLLQDLLHDGRLVAPFKGQAATQRGYYIEIAAHAVDNADVRAFAQWLHAQADPAPAHPAAGQSRKTA